MTPGALEWTVNAYVLALASLIIVGGTLGDRYGRKRLYLSGLAIFAIFSAACGLARTDLELIVHRALQGVGAAIMAPLTLSILVDAYPPDRRTTAIGIWASVAGLGFLAGPIVGGLLIALSGRSAVFFVNIPIAVVGFAVAAASVRESRDEAARALDPVGTILVTIGLFLLTFALIESNVHHWLSTYTLSLGAVALAALLAFVAHEARTAHPIGAAVGLAVLGSISVATASASWRAALGALPDGARGATPHMIQQVAGAEAQAVAAVLGPAVLVPALDAFIAGYRLALTVAGILLLAGAVIGFTFLRERGSSAPTGRGAALPDR